MTDYLVLYILGFFQAIIILLLGIVINSIRGLRKDLSDIQSDLSGLIEKVKGHEKLDDERFKDIHYRISAMEK